MAARAESAGLKRGIDVAVTAIIDTRRPVLVGPPCALRTPCQKEDTTAMGKTLEFGGSLERGVDATAAPTPPPARAVTSKPVPGIDVHRAVNAGES